MGDPARWRILVTVSFRTLRALFGTVASAAGMSERRPTIAGNWNTQAMLDQAVRRDDDARRVGLRSVGDVMLGTFCEKLETSTLNTSKLARPAGAAYLTA